MLTFIILSHPKGVWENVFLINLTFFCLHVIWQMLSLIVSMAVVIARQMLFALFILIGRCYCQEVDGIPLFLADVVANDVADV